MEGSLLTRQELPLACAHLHAHFRFESFETRSVHAHALQLPACVEVGDEQRACLHSGQQNAHIRPMSAWRGVWRGHVACPGHPACALGHQQQVQQGGGVHCASNDRSSKVGVCTVPVATGPARWGCALGQ
eukprot:scaffold60931_cov24-Tisochrysis_lutea.AAC.2